jgi:ABC-type multidrug transport system fused ATPase/permease subunit
VLVQRAIDNSVVHHHQPLWPYLASIVVLAALRMAINFTRRYATARVGIRIDARMRELLYRAYLVFPREFYDRHATAQVLSRARRSAGRVAGSTGLKPATSGATDPPRVETADGD